MNDSYLLPELRKLVNSYVGTVKTHYSRGNLRWTHLVLYIELQTHVDVQQWVKESENMQAVADAYVKATPFYKRVKDDDREVRMLPSKIHQAVEILVETEQTENDSGDSVIELDSGLFVPPAPYLNLDLKVLTEQLARDWTWTAHRISASCVPEDFFMRRWVRNVGGHGFRKRHIFWCSPYDAVECEVDSTDHLFSRRTLWDERHQNGCNLTEACVCWRCTYDDPDHLNCSNNVCRTRKRLKV